VRRWGSSTHVSGREECVLCSAKLAWGCQGCTNDCVLEDGQSISVTLCPCEAPNCVDRCGFLAMNMHTSGAELGSERTRAVDVPMHKRSMHKKQSAAPDILAVYVDSGACRHSVRSSAHKYLACLCCSALSVATPQELVSRPLRSHDSVGIATNFEIIRHTGLDPLCCRIHRSPHIRAIPTRKQRPNDVQGTMRLLRHITPLALAIPPQVTLPSTSSSSRS